MLVLSRKSEQKIVIGNRKKVVVTILKVQGNVVQLGFESDDKETPIYRAELLEQIEQENSFGALKSKGIDVKGLAKKLRLKKEADA